MRYVVARKGMRKISLNVAKILGEEKFNDLDNINSCEKFKDNCENSKINLKKMLGDYKNKGKKNPVPPSWRVLYQVVEYLLTELGEDQQRVCMPVDFNKDRIWGKDQFERKIHSVWVPECLCSRFMQR